MQAERTNAPARSGFTLFEMAVVVAIIGMIVGAIAAGRNYLEGAKLTTLVAQSKYYLHAFNQFESTYAAIPGDISTASTIWTATSTMLVAGDGDGNGLVVLSTNNYPEYFQAFDHMARAGLIKGTYSGVAGANGNQHGVAKTNLPETSIDATAFWFLDVAPSVLLSADTTYFDGTYAHPLRVGKQATGSTNSMPIDAFLLPGEAYKLDDKYDDGMPGLGWIRTPKNTATGASNCATTDVTTTAAYSVTYKLPACWFIFTQT